MSIHNAVASPVQKSVRSSRLSKAPTCSIRDASARNIIANGQVALAIRRARSLITSPFQFKKRQKKAEPALIIYLASCLSAHHSPGERHSAWKFCSEFYSVCLQCEF